MAIVTEEILIGSKADTRGFKKAQTASEQLSKSLKKLTGALGLAYGARAVTAYGKAAVKAFSEDESAARRLATAVDNLGLSFSQTRVADFIAQTEASSGILDDQLRPAMQALLTTTGSLTKSQELLNNAIQISRASGVDLATVAQDLANGYVGITRGLKKYNTGLTQSELKTKSFNDILGVMLAKSAGAAQDYLTTTAYKMDVLNVASENAKETIGKGLVDAFARIGGGTEAKDAAKAIDNIAKAASNVLVVLGTAIGAVEKFRKAYTNFLAGGDVNAIMAGTPTSTNRSKSPAGTAARTAQQRASEAAAAVRAKELANLTKKQVASQKALTAEQKKQNALKKAGTIFDMDQIQIIAALKGKISAEDRKRLELQLALATENVDQVAILTKELAISQGLGKDLAAFLADLPSAKNPFEAWKSFLDGIESQAARIAAMSFQMPNFSGLYGTQVPNFTPYITTPFPDTTSPSFIGPQAPNTVVVNVAGSVTTSQSLIDEIRGGLNVAALSGSSANVERRIGGW